MSTPHRAGAVLVSAGAAVATIGTFLTWIRSGATGRSSYDVFDMVDRLGFSPDGAVGWALRLWPLVPLLFVVSVVAAWWPVTSPRWRSMRIVLTLGAALYPGATALVVANAPEAGNLFGIGIGPAVTAIGVLVMVAGLAVEPLSATRRARSRRP